MSKHLAYKGVRIKKIPWFLGFLFNPRKRNGMAYGSQIYVSEKVYHDLRTKNPDPFHIAILEHEITHLKGKRQIGKWKYGLKFWLSPKFRLQEELRADRAMMLYLKKRKLSFPIEKRAKKLSSKLYFWMISYPEAKRKLTRIWKTLEVPP
ncbi:MAG: hypothetical protein ACOZBZ_00620 [Patescibacteria group bacterium]